MKKATAYLPAALCWALGIPPLFYRILNTGVIALLMMGAIFFFLAFFRHGLPSWLRRGALCAVALAFLYFGVVSAFMVRYAYFNRPPGGSDAVVVLGCKINGDQPSRLLRQRLDAAYAYLSANPQANCIVSGGQGADEDYPEAQVMAAYLEKRGIEPRRIRQEPGSTNTYTNLQNSGALLTEEEASIVIVTSQFHQLRAAVFARSQGLSFYSVSASCPPGLLPSYWVREWFGVTYACFDTGILR